MTDLERRALMGDKEAQRECTDGFTCSDFLSKDGKCSHCDRKYYIKVKRYLRPLLAPVTHAQELEQELENITGESYMQVKINYCPICGRKVKGD